MLLAIGRKRHFVKMINNVRNSIYASTTQYSRRGFLKHSQNFNSPLQGYRNCFIPRLFNFPLTSASRRAARGFYPSLFYFYVSRFSPVPVPLRAVGSSSENEESGFGTKLVASSCNFRCQGLELIRITAVSGEILMTRIRKRALKFDSLTFAAVQPGVIAARMHRITRTHCVYRELARFCRSQSSSE